MFKVYITVIHYFCTLYSTIGYYKIMGVIPSVIQYIRVAYLFFIYSSLYLLISYPLFAPPPYPVPCGNHKFVTALFNVANSMDIN